MNTIETMQVIETATVQGDNNLKEAIQVLSDAFVDYKKSNDSVLKDIRRINKAYSTEVDLPIESSPYFAEYVTKGTGNFEVSGGYSIIPQISILNNTKANIKSLMQLGTKVIQTSGTEHVLVEIPSLTRMTEAGSLPMLEASKTILKLLAIEFGLFLESDLITGPMPVNFQSVIENSLQEKFAEVENGLFVSDEGLPNQIQGIGQLTGEGFDSDEIEYANADAQLYEKLLSMVTKLKQDYSEGAVWFMSPRVLAAISNMRDKNGRFIKDSGAIDELFGHKVYCHNGFDSTHNQIIFANVERGYTVVEHGHILALHDKYTNLRGVRNIFKKLVAGAVTDKSAWMSLRIAGLPAGTLKFS